MCECVWILEHVRDTETSGLCSRNPLQRQQSEAVVIRSQMRVDKAAYGAAGRHHRKRASGCRVFLFFFDWLFGFHHVRVKTLNTVLVCIYTQSKTYFFHNGKTGNTKCLYQPFHSKSCMFVHFWPVVTLESAGDYHSSSCVRRLLPSEATSCSKFTYLQALVVYPVPVQ